MAREANSPHVAVAIIRRGEAILAIRRRSGPMAGGWEFPEVSVEEGGAPEEALRREVLGRLGCSLSTMWPLDVIEYDCPDLHLSMDCFVCIPAQGEEPVAREHQELRWLTAGELLSVEWLPANRAIVTELGMAWSEIFSENRF